MYGEAITEDQQVIRILKGPQWVRTYHGSLFDRGSADSYYGRARDPHFGGVGSTMVRTTDLNPEEVAEYQAGYDWNEQYGDKKSYF